MVDIYKATELQGKYPPLSPTLRIIIDGICHMETKKSFLLLLIHWKMVRNTSWCVILSLWLLRGEEYLLINQCTQWALFTRMKNTNTFHVVFLPTSINLQLENCYLYMDTSQTAFVEVSKNSVLLNTLQDYQSLLPSSSKHVWGRVLALGGCSVKVILSAIALTLCNTSLIPAPHLWFCVMGGEA